MKSQQFKDAISKVDAELEEDQFESRREFQKAFSNKIVESVDDKEVGKMFAWLWYMAVCEWEC